MTGDEPTWVFAAGIGGLLSVMVMVWTFVEAVIG